MSKELKVKEGSALSTGEELAGGEDILSSTVVIPKLLLMQGLSDFVAEGKAQMGDMVRSTTGQKVGNAEQAVPFVPLTFTNTWILSEKIGGKFEYRGQEPMTAKNQDAPWEFEKDGTQWKRTKSFNLYALLVSDIEAEKAELAKAQNGEMADPEKALMPVLISFRSTSFAAGKDIATHFAKARKFKLPGHVSILELKCRREKNDKGTFFVFEAAPKGMAPKEYRESSEYWKELVVQNKVKVDESDETPSNVEAEVVSGASQF